MKKVILVDGNNLLFRSYYATAYNGVIMRNSKGFPTNALYGFINMMNKIIVEEQPSYIMVAFDKGKTFRHERYASYKAGRSETPEELKQQFPKAKEVLQAMGIIYFEIDQYEADDIIGTLAKRVDEEEEFVATIVSSDKDLLQLISDEVDVKLLKQTGFLRMDRAAFMETYGVEPIRMIDLKALMGDASDHIPGVKGIGEKTAISLLKEFGSLDQIYSQIDAVKGKTKEKLLQDKEQAYMSYDLATIYREVPIPFSLEELHYSGLNKEQYVALLQELEFHSLLKKLDVLEKVEPPSAVRSSMQEVVVLTDFSAISFTHPLAFYLEMVGTNYHKGEPVGLGIYDGENSYYIPFATLLKNLSSFDVSLLKYTYDLKRHQVAFAHSGMLLENCDYDAMIAAYLLNYNLKDDPAFLAQVFDYQIPFYEDIYGTEKRPKAFSLEMVARMACQKAQFIYETRERMEQELREQDQWELFCSLEMPLVSVLSDMELTGISVDSSYLSKMGDEIKSKMDQLAEEIYENAGSVFNIMSPKQLGEVLFEQMSLPYPKKIKDRSYSTSKDILDKLVNVHPIIQQILDYRTLSKLYTNYIVGLLAEIAPDGKVHTTFTQTLTRTGRLSSISPNLQNIPVRLEYGRLIRKAFVPSENALLLSSDYSQIDLRVFAHMSLADNLVQAFKEGKDIHRKTAADIFQVSEEMVTKDMRRTAKAVNFGILYGISSFGLSEDLGIDVRSAKAFIDTYLATYPGIREYMDLEVKKAYEMGYVTTFMKRRRVIEELKSKNYMIRSQGERMALNTPIQGGSADILKKAMIDIYRIFKERNLKSKMLIQVHDELIFDVFHEELAEVEQIVKDTMEHTVTLKVPLLVEMSTGSNWYEAK